MKKQLIKGILQLIPLVAIIIPLFKYISVGMLKVTGEMIFGIAVGLLALKLAEQGWNNIRRYFEERKKKKREEIWAMMATDGIREAGPDNREKEKCSPEELADVPFPKCSNKCGIVGTLGVSECDSVCPEKEEKEEK